MNMEEFMTYDSYQVMFPDVQNDEIRSFGKILVSVCGKDCKIIKKVSNVYKKKNKSDILYVEFNNNPKGLLGVVICLSKFDIMFKLKLIKYQSRIDIPKRIREISDIEFDEIEQNMEYFKNEQEHTSNFFLELTEKIKTIMVQKS